MTAQDYINVDKKLALELAKKNKIVGGFEKTANDIILTIAVLLAIFAFILLCYGIC